MTPNENFKPNWEEKIEDFEAMGLKEELVHGIFAYGFKVPSEIQQLAIKPICAGRQVIAQAQSGTGKTGAFGCGILNSIDTKAPGPQALILAPTRELAAQTHVFLTEVGRYLSGLDVGLFVGGHPIEEDEKRARERPQIGVGTPGRIVDLLSRNIMPCDDLHILCLDEADQLLADDFVRQIQDVFRYIDEKAQLLLFSATIPLSAFNVMDEFMRRRDPVQILVQAEQLTLEGIRQFKVEIPEDKKLDALLDLYGLMPIQKCVIFANMQKDVDMLSHEMQKRHFAVSAIHAGMSQREREEVMKQFRLQARTLIGTNLIARGIDVQQVTLVINFEIPRDKESYLHRIGRSARWGRKGVAINLVSPREKRMIQDIEKHYGTKIEDLPENFAGIVEEANDSAA